MGKKDKQKLADNARERRADPFFAVVAKVYEVPPTGISAIDGQPYLNKDGRLCLLHKKRQGEMAVQGFKTEFLKYSMGAAEPAVVKKILAFKDGSEYDAIGEAGADNVGSSDVKKTLNMVAETRALCRVIWLAIGGEVTEMVEKNLEVMDISDQDRARIVEAGRVSYEEVSGVAATKAAGGEEKAEKGRRVYELTVAQIEAIIGDKQKLTKAREGIDGVPLTPEEKKLVLERIDRALENLGDVIQMDAPPEAETAEPVAKDSARPKGKKTR